MARHSQSSILGHIEANTELFDYCTCSQWQQAQHLFLTWKLPGQDMHPKGNSSSFPSAIPLGTQPVVGFDCPYHFMSIRILTIILVNDVGLFNIVIFGIVIITVINHLDPMWSNLTASSILTLPNQELATKNIFLSFLEFFDLAQLKARAHRKWHRELKCHFKHRMSAKGVNPVIHRWE